MAGVVAGAVVAITGPGGRDPGRALLAAGVAAAAGLGAGAADRWRRRGLWTGLALVTALGLYAGVPETNHIIGLAGGLAVLTLADCRGLVRMTSEVVLALDVVLVWAALWGAGARDGAAVAGLAMLGLLAALPVAAALPGPSRALMPERWQAAALVGLQAAYALALARLAAWRPSVVEVGIIVVVAALLLLGGGRVVMGPRRW